MPLPQSTATLIRHGVRDIITAALDDPAWPVIAGALAAGKASDAAVGIVTYPAGDPAEEIGAGQTITAVQVTIRGALGAGSDPVTDAQQVIRDALTWNLPRDVNGVLVVLSFRQITSSPPVPDNLGRLAVYDTFDMRSGRLGLIPSTT